MKLLFLAAAPEASPLPKLLAALGHEVRVAVPLGSGRRPTTRVVARVAVPTVGGEQVAEVFVARRGGVTLYTIARPRLPRAAPPLTEAAQSIFISLAAIGLCRARDWMPDVLHALDPAYGAALYWLATDGLRDDELGDIATVLSVDDVAAPFVAAPRDLSAYGLTPSDAPHLPDTARDSLLGLGLAHADGLAATSDANAEYLAGLTSGGAPAHLPFAWPGRMAGLRPGLDLVAWDPAHDPALRQRYDVDRLERRAANKRILQRELKLAVGASGPLFAVLTAHETPASLDLVLPALRELLWSGAPAQFVVIGPAGPDPAAELKALARTFPGQLAAVRRTDARLVRRVYAGADALLAASPDSANHQPAWRALRYGAVPIAHVLHAPPSLLLGQEFRGHSHGFVFHDYNSGALIEALQQAQRAYGRPASQHTRWVALQRRGMRAVARWGPAQAVEAHLALYQHAIRVRKEKREQLARLLEDFPAAGDPPPGPGSLPHRPHEDPRRNPRRR